MNAQPRLIVRALCALFAVLVASSSVSATGLSDADVVAVDKSERLEMLRNAAATDGTVRVIVRLADGAGIKPLLPTPAMRSRGESGSWRGMDMQAALASRHDSVVRARDAFLIKHNLEADRAEGFAYFPFVVLEADEALLEELAESPAVADITFDDVNHATLSSTLPVIGADVAHQLGWDGAGYDIAILDTGVDTDHPMLVGNVVPETAACFSRQYYTSDVSLCPSNVPQCTDELGNPMSFSACGAGAAEPCAGLCAHGTHVAGIAAGDGAETGVAPGAGIIPVNVFVGRDSTNDGSPEYVVAYDSDIIRGLEHVLRLSTTRNIAAVNMSLGGGLYTTTAECDARKGAFKAVIDELRAVGVATVVAAGNNGSSTALSSPGCISSVISVGSTRDDDYISSFSNETPALTLHAPGENVRSALPGTGYGGLSGTSMATPHVAGAVAVLRQKAENVGLTIGVDNIIAALQQTGVEMYSGDFKVPRVNVADALTVLDGQAPVTVVVDDVLDEDHVEIIAGSATLVNSSFAYGGQALRGDTAGINRIRFTPSLPEDGAYRVSVMWPLLSETGEAVEVNIMSESGMHSVLIDQSVGAGIWHDMGVHAFVSDTPGYIEFADAAGGRVLADAVRFERVGAAVPEIFTTTLPVGWQDARYFVQLIGSGGIAPYAWSAQGLPAGLSLDPETGVIDGLPSDAGSFTVDIVLTDQNGDAAVASFALEIADATTYPSYVNINFQPINSPVPAGYGIDSGAVYGERSNGLSYGWNANNTASARDRDDPVAPDQRYDTLNHFRLRGDFDWRLSLPNGEYSVRLVAGDPTYFEGLRQKLLVEGMVAVDQTLGGSTRWADETVAVTVTDGELNIAAAADAIGSKLMFVEVERVQSGPGNTAPTVAITSPGDAASYEEGDAVVLEADAADSDGSVVLVEFYADGQKLGEDATAPYSLLWSDVSAGSHTLTAVATDDQGATAVSAEVSLSVTGPFPAVVKVNFQPAGSAVPSGYEPDYGDVFADRSNGLSYGWSADNSASARDRDVPAAPDQRYDTLSHLALNGDFDWRLSLPNGEYTVRLVAGDPTYFEGLRQKLLVEGMVAVDQTLGGSTRWADETVAVTVTDGELNIAAAAGAIGPKLMFVEVERVQSGLSNAAPTVMIGSPVDGASYDQGDAIVLDAEAADSDGSVVLVEFYADGQKLGEDATAPYSLLWTDASAGSHTVTAVATDDQGAQAVSADVNVSVNAPFPAIVKVNFQSPGSPVPSGYEPDYGYVFGERSNGLSYGWNADNTGSARDRDDPDAPDQRYDTLTHVEQYGSVDWEVAVPSGQYQVRVVAGDPTYYEGKAQLIFVEGQTAVDAMLGGSVCWVDETLTVMVADGRLTIGGDPSAPASKLLFVEIIRLD